MSLAQFTSNRTVVERLQKMAANDRIPPSLLFSGPEEAGLLRVAVNFAKALNCVQTSAPDARGERDSCDTCAACLRIEQGAHPDVRQIAPEGAGGQVKVEAVRQVVAESPFRPFEGRKRVYIFETADRMNPTAANTLLKTLEEPPPWTVLILLTTNEAAILPTLLSRCQRIRFLPLQPQEMVDTLVEEHGISQSNARLAAGIAAGNLSRALELADNVGSLHEEALRIASLPTRQTGRSQILSWAGQLAKASDLPVILRLAVCQLRDLASLASGGDALHSEVDEEIEATANRVPLEVWLDGFLRLEQAIYDLEVRYASKRITLEHTLLYLDRLGKPNRRRGAPDNSGTDGGRGAA